MFCIFNQFAYNEVVYNGCQTVLDLNLGETIDIFEELLHVLRQFIPVDRIYFTLEQLIELANHYRLELLPETDALIH